MLAQARPMWSQLPDGALRRQLQAELARLGALAAEELAALWRSGPPATVPAAGTGEARTASRARPRPTSLAARQPPRRPEDRALQMLLARSDWWDTLSATDHELLHALPAPHGALVSWLERELAEHGPRPWATLRLALAEDSPLADHSIDAAAWMRDVDTGDAHDAQPDDLRRAVDRLHERTLKASLDAAAQAAQRDPGSLARYRELLDQMAALKRRQAGEAA
jgi:DNA primase